MSREDGTPAGAFVSGPLVMREAALFTDLYELTMAAAYLREGMNAPATFSLFVRRLPDERAFLVTAGLEDVLDYLRDFRFSEEAVAYLATLGRFDRTFLDYLHDLRFTGDVRAVPEGTVLFADEPLLEIRAPIIEGQLVETAVINFCHLQTTLASKAARSVIAAGGRPIVDFGLRRTHGMDAGMKAARSAYIVGAAATSNVLAARAYRIPPSGTMAHSFVSAFPREIDSFRAFAHAFPRNTVLLIDTYDTIGAARKAVEVAREMASRGERLDGVRLDSGDIVALSKAVRAILDDAGFENVHIFVSGGLDEYGVERFLAEGAPIDAFGIGTRMNVSADAPYLDMAYKLVTYAGRYVLKTSPGKETWTGAKQVFRLRHPDGRFEGDVLGLEDEAAPQPTAEALLVPVMAGGRLLGPHPPLGEVRDHCRREIETLPEGLRRIRQPVRYTVRYSDRLVSLQRSLAAEVTAAEAVPRSE